MEIQATRAQATNPPSGRQGGGEEDKEKQEEKGKKEEKRKTESEWSESRCLPKGWIPR